MSDPENIKPRVPGIDVARGIALMGILFVNVQFFGQPFGSVFQNATPESEGWFSMFAYWFTNIFCTGKFYPLFSLLFGAGLAMMYQSSVQRGGSFGWIYLRRIFMLAGIGIAHIVFLWYGDILLIYAFIALLMIWMARFSSRTLLIVGGSTYLLGLLMMVPLFALLTIAGEQVGEVVPKPMPEAESAVEKFFRVLPDWNQTEIFDSRLIKLERQIMVEGPFGAAIAIRLFNYVFSAVFVGLVMFWVIFPGFCAGASMMKSGFFHGENRFLRTWFIRLGFVAGLPLSVFSVWAQHDLESPLLLVAGSIGMNICGPLIALMYLSLILDWVESGRIALLARAFANPGKMALTGYLLESLIMAGITQHWGFARFGNNTFGERFVWVILVFLVVLVFSNLWMIFFAQGPIEYVWRKWTYLGRR